MADRAQYSENDPRHHIKKLKDMLTQIVDHAREDVGKVNDPKAQALFETTDAGTWHLEAGLARLR